MNRIDWIVLICFILTIANGVFALFENSNNGMYAQFMILWLLMTIVLKSIDDINELSDLIRKILEKSEEVR